MCIHTMTLLLGFCVANVAIDRFRRNGAHSFSTVHIILCVLHCCNNNSNEAAISSTLETANYCESL